MGVQSTHFHLVSLPHATYSTLSCESHSIRTERSPAYLVTEKNYLPIQVTNATRKVFRFFYPATMTIMLNEVRLA